MPNVHFGDSLGNLEKHLIKNDFKGYDPYDTLNSKIPFQKFGKWIPILATQFQKRNPVNIRPLLGIKKEFNPKALGLFLNAFVKQYHMSGEEHYLKECEQFIETLKTLRSKGYPHYCWGYNFPWASPLKTVPAYHPSVVATAFIVNGLYEYYQRTGKDEIREMILSSASYVLEDLPRIENEKGICISYTDIQMDICFNASLLGAEILSYAFQLTGEDSYREIAVRSLDYVCAYQKMDGRWNYSLNQETGEEREQIDFHQGYILESAAQIIQNCELGDEYDSVIKKGLEYYRNEQFFDNGRSLWRIPKKWPVEIHNQAQGIITFVKLKKFNPEYETFARKIVEWTVEHMQDPKGFFYYQKHRFYTIKIPYMRWSQAWMYLALTDLMYYSKK